MAQSWDFEETELVLNTTGQSHNNTYLGSIVVLTVKNDNFLKLLDHIQP